MATVGPNEHFPSLPTFLHSSYYSLGKLSSAPAASHDVSGEAALAAAVHERSFKGELIVFSFNFCAIPEVRHKPFSRSKDPQARIRSGLRTHASTAPVSPHMHRRPISHASLLLHCPADPRQAINAALMLRQAGLGRPPDTSMTRRRRRTTCSAGRFCPLHAAQRRPRDLRGDAAAARTRRCRGARLDAVLLRVGAQLARRLRLRRGWSRCVAGSGRGARHVC